MLRTAFSTPAASYIGTCRTGFDTVLRAFCRTGAPLLLAGLLGLPAVWIALPAEAALSPGQRACVDGLSRALDKLDRQASRQIAACLKNHARGKPLDPSDPAIDTVEECALADPRGRIARATAGAAKQFEKLCSPPPAGKLEDPFPPFGATDAARVSGAGLGLGPDLAHDLFGPDLDAALGLDRDAAKCQQVAWQAATRCQQARTAAFRSCQKARLRRAGGTPAAESREELREVCLGAGAEAQPDAQGRLAAKCGAPGQGIAKALRGACADQDLAALFPGCAGEPDTSVCLDRQAACRACLAVSDAGGLRRSCDLFDDGTANASCGETPIHCESPADGAMVAAAPGAEVELAGQVVGASQLEGVSVDGVPVELDAEGFFSHPVTAGFGLHAVEVAGYDETGAERRRTCSFLASESFVAEDAFLDGALSLRLAQAAVDDGSRPDLDSLADILHAVLNSSGLRDQIHAALAAANPLKPSSCDQNVCLPIIGCTCVLSSQITYLNSSISGPRTVALALVSGGLQTAATAQTINLSLRANGSLAGISYDTTGTVSIASLSSQLVSDVFVQNGAVRASVRPGSVSVSVGSISTNFSGLDGEVINLIVALANGLIRSTLQGVMSSYVQSNLDDALDALLSGLEIPATGLDVPRLAAPGAIALSLEAAASSASVTPTRALLGLGARATAPASHARPSLGVAMPTGPLLADPGAGTPLAFAGHLVALNQVLHALWRGGLLDGQLDPLTVPALPVGGSAAIEALLPPIVVAGDGAAALAQLGALRVTLSYPGVFDTPVLLSAGAEATLTLAVEGDSLQLESLALDTLHVSGVDEPLTAAQESAIEAAMAAILEHLLGGALAAAAPGLPIPAFEIPASLGPYGLPAGEHLGLVGGALELMPNHVYLTGNFGILP
jgi:hypothetical protein